MPLFLFTLTFLLIQIAAADRTQAQTIFTAEEFDRERQIDLLLNDYIQINLFSS
jgi:hypothetical protein